MYTFIYTCIFVCLCTRVCTSLSLYIYNQIYVLGWPRAGPCRAVPKVKFVPRLSCQPCQVYASCRASRFVPAVLFQPCLPWKVANTSARWLCAVPCHISWPWGLRYGLVVHAKGFTPFCPCVGQTKPCSAVPFHALPCHIVSPCRAIRAGPQCRARIIRAVPCLHLNRAVPAVSCNAFSSFVP